MSDSRVHRAPRGGATVIEGRYLGGEFLPFYVPRPLMPQVDEVYYPRIIADAATTPGVTFDTVPVADLRAHQRIDHRKAEKMDPRVRIKPIIVSNDGYIVDGNHRWWANVYAGSTWINVIRLALDFDAAIAWALERPYVYRLKPTTPERN